MPVSRTLHRAAGLAALALLCASATGEAAPVAPVAAPPAATADLARPLLVALPTPGVAPASVAALPTSPAAASGVPENMLAAYRSAEAAMSGTAPACALRWYHLAGIGKIESGHARGGQADAAGDTAPRILGPVLAGGPGVAAIRDTDAGRLDTDPVWDRAVGPMQFIPGTWTRYAADANGDGTADPHNIADATLGAARYLCSGNLRLDNPADLSAAVFRYNHSTEYVATVTGWMRIYSDGAVPVPAQPAGTSPESALSTKPTAPEEQVVPLTDTEPVVPLTDTEPVVPLPDTEPLVPLPETNQQPVAPPAPAPVPAPAPAEQFAASEEPATAEESTPSANTSLRPPVEPPEHPLPGRPVPTAPAAPEAEPQPTCGHPAITLPTAEDPDVEVTIDMQNCTLEHPGAVEPTPETEESTKD
ncbi:lytic murein transglycosylase [Actinokineospora sp. G85]|uniref:lytic transglycosylase domain-containing protein n=1 Tax=Actinokineospora sp. G85 TaxID=3406626 RepID=UPI003C72F082